MKILIVLLILLQINTFDYGNYNYSYSNHYNSYNSISAEQTNQGIEYTTRDSINTSIVPLLTALLLYVGYDILFRPTLKK